MDSTALAQIPEERVYAGVAAIQQSEIRELIQELSEKQIEFLKIRSMCSTDAKARHILGRNRPEDQADKDCGCGLHELGWRDMRQRTVIDWKQEGSIFRQAYDLLLREPLMFASARLEGLAPKAVQAYDDLLEETTKPEVRRAAAKDVMEGTGLKATPGVPGSGNAVRESFSFKMAMNRYGRGLEISDEQRDLLRSGGVVVETTEVAPGKFLVEGSTERTLDGDDIPIRGDDNSEYLPD